MRFSDGKYLNQTQEMVNIYLVIDASCVKEVILCKHFINIKNHFRLISLLCFSCNFVMLDKENYMLGLLRVNISKSLLSST